MQDREPHPSLESLAAFTEGRTTAAERALIVRHLPRCSECYTLVAETASYLQTEIEAGETRRAHSGPWWGLAAAAAVIVVALGFFARTHRGDRLAEIAAAASTSHPLHVRISGGVVPGAAVMRGDEPKSNEDLLRLYLELKNLRQSDESAQTLHAFGLTALLLGRNDEAIVSLQQAAARSNDAAMWSDLAAAHEARWEANASSADLDQADALSKRALAIDPHRAETLFNRAQVLEAEGNRAEAIALWKRYLIADANTAWAAIARKRLRELSAPTTSERWSVEGARLRAALLPNRGPAFAD